MIPLKQQYLHRPKEGQWGDCHRAAIASVLELLLEMVPHFGHEGPDGDEFNRRVDAFLQTQGMVQITTVYADDGLELILSTVGAMNKGIYYLLGGRSKTGVDHTVVCLDGEIVHDPSINGSGITGPCNDGWYWITFLGSARCKQ